MIQKQRNRMRIEYLVGVMLLLLACQTVNSQQTPGVPPPDTARPTPLRVITATSPATDSAAQPDTPVQLQPRPAKSSAPGIACVGTDKAGVLCLENDKWVEYSRRKDTLSSDYIRASAVCPDGRIVVAHGSGISIYTDRAWDEFAGGWGYASAEAVTCDLDGGLWVAHFEGASRYDDRRWTTYWAGTDFDSDEPVSDLIRDVAIAPSGDVWIVAADSVVRLHDEQWTVYREGQGFDSYVSFEKLAIAPDGRVWVAGSRGAFVFDGEEWRTYETTALYSPKALVIDDQGRVWVGTFNDGIHVLKSGEWRRYNVANGSLSSDKIRAMEIDGRGRIWVATEWGLNIFSDNEWRSYRMDNTDMTEHNLVSLGVVDGGPTTIPTIEKAPGSMSGRIVDKSGTPLTGLSLELCVERLRSYSADVTPCTGQVFIRTTQTTAEGGFRFEALPPGYYVITVQYEEEWIQIRTPVGMNSERYLVTENENTYTGEFILIPNE
ncbi:MAG: carboxypeptidase regulatory-like domain-containing protein [Anaerolineae bacterium]|nr:carboxypeptidase regulatory-like domain-containing protein [Anaerolineae bacterium]